MSTNRSSNRQKKPRASFLSAFLSFPARVAGWLAASAVGRFFHAYDKSCEAVNESRTVRCFTGERMKETFSPWRRRIGELFTSSPLARLLGRIGDILRYTETRAYGILFATFGLYTILVYVIRYFAQWARDGKESALITGIAVTLLSIPLLFSSRPAYVTMQESRLLNAFFYRLIGLPQYPYVKKKTLTISASAAFLIGSVFGIVCFFVHPLYLLFGLAGIAVFLLLLFSPELCLYSALTLCPFFFLLEHPAFLLAVLVLIGTVSYLIKLLLGKRTFSFKPLDLTVLLLGIMYIGAALFSRGGAASSSEAILYAVLLLGYFLAANLLSSSAAIQRAITALIFGGSATALLGLYQQFAGKAVADWMDNAAYDYIGGRITAAFGNPNVLATYLILLFPFVTAGILKSGRLRERAGSLLLLTLFMAAIIFTWSRGAWAGVILSIAIFLFAYNPATMYIWIPAAAGSFVALQHLGSAVAARIESAFFLLSDSSISYRVSTWQGALAMAKDHLFSGIGVGEEAFAAVYPYYSLSGIEAAPHAHNLMLQYLCEFGVIGPLLLLLFTVTFFQCVISHQHEETSAPLRLYGLASGGGILAVLLFGLTDHVFYNARIFFLFFAVAGIAAAISRVGKIERVRSTPLHDTGAKVYAIDIEIDEE